MNFYLNQTDVSVVGFSTVYLIREIYQYIILIHFIRDYDQKYYFIDQQNNQSDIENALVCLDIPRQPSSVLSSNKDSFSDRSLGRRARRKERRRDTHDAHLRRAAQRAASCWLGSDLVWVFTRRQPADPDRPTLLRRRDFEAEAATSIRDCLCNAKRVTARQPKRGPPFSATPTSRELYRSRTRTRARSNEIDLDHWHPYIITSRAISVLC